MKILRSFRYAWNGIRYCLVTQANYRVHVVIFLAVVIAGMLFSLNPTEWLFIIVVSMLVLILEMINTALEYLCDRITKNSDPLIKIIKDVSAGAVLISAVGSIATGLIIFLPRIIRLLE